MVKVLAFEDDDRSRERFRQLYNGLVTGAFIAAQQEPSSKDKRKLDDAEREAEVHELLEAISAESDDAQTSVGEPMRELTAPTTLRLKQPQIDTLRKYMELYIPSAVCKSTNTRKAVDALHWLKGAQELKDEAAPAATG